MSSRSAVENKETDIPEKLYDASSKTVYNRLRFFGKVSSICRRSFRASGINKVVEPVSQSAFNSYAEV